MGNLKGSVWLIFRDPRTGNYLVGKRSKELDYPNKWNFIGGHVSKETAKVAALRHCFLGCGIKISAQDLKEPIKDNSILWFEVFKRIEPRKTELVSSYKWVTPLQMKGLSKHNSIVNYFVALKKLVGT